MKNANFKYKKWPNHEAIMESQIITFNQILFQDMKKQSFCNTCDRTNCFVLGKIYILVNSSDGHNPYGITNKPISNYDVPQDAEENINQMGKIDLLSYIQKM
jgi:hypothetical protein